MGVNRGESDCCCRDCVNNGESDCCCRGVNMILEAVDLYDWLEYYTPRSRSCVCACRGDAVYNKFWLVLLKIEFVWNECKRSISENGGDDVGLKSLRCEFALVFFFIS